MSPAAWNIPEGFDRRPSATRADRMALDSSRSATIPDASTRRFDILPLLVATDGALEAFGRDPPASPPNLLEILATRRLLDVRLANDLHYRVAPASAE